LNSTRQQITTEAGAYPNKGPPSTEIEAYKAETLLKNQVNLGSISKSRLNLHPGRTAFTAGTAQFQEVGPGCQEAQVKGLARNRLAVPFTALNVPHNEPFPAIAHQPNLALTGVGVNQPGIGQILG